MEDKTKIILMDKSESSLEATNRLLKNISGIEIIQTSTNIDDLKSFIADKIPTLVLIGPTYTLDDIQNFKISYGAGFGFLKIILFVKESSPDIFKKAIKQNIFDVIEFPFNYNDLKESLTRAKLALSESSNEISGLPGDMTNIDQNDCKTIMIFGTKGGSGKSFIATNLAIDLQSLTKKNVVLMDLNYQSGDIALLLNIVPKHTIFDITSIIDQLDQEMLATFLTPFGSGLKVLPAPINPTQAESISSKATSKIINTLRKICDFLVIDTPATFSEDILYQLEKVDYLCMVASMEVPSIKSMKVALEVLGQLKFPKEKTIIIINRANTKVG
ncbi:MAG: nucleotide-binding protein, partial [Candidatus Humimicrobiaceae bacterium]